MLSRPHTHRKCRFESLEQRNVLAGNVTAAVVDGDLVITGDDLGNVFTLDQPGGPGTDYRLIGNDTTTINGGPSPITLPGSGAAVTNDILIDLLGGDDIVRVAGVHAPDDLEIDAGVGNDLVAVFGSDAGIDTQVDDDLKIIGKP